MDTTEYEGKKRPEDFKSEGFEKSKTWKGLHGARGNGSLKG